MEPLYKSRLALVLLSVSIASCSGTTSLDNQRDGGAVDGGGPSNSDGGGTDPIPPPPEQACSVEGGKTVVAIHRPEGFKPLGTCYSSGGACSSDDDCIADLDHGNNWCVKSRCHGSPDTVCTGDDDCPGGDSCAEEIVITLDKEYQCGYFLGGEPYVVADEENSVVLESVTPSHLPSCESGDSACRNGWGLDPVDKEQFWSGKSWTGVDDNPSLIDVNARLADVDGVHSIVKTITGGWEGNSAGYDCNSGGTGKSCTYLAGVLTIAPNGNPPPAHALRPPAYGPDKPPWYTLDDIRFDRLANIPSSALDGDILANRPSWEECRARFSGVNLGINDANANTGGQGTEVVGASNYHRDRTTLTNDCLLSLLVDTDFANDPVQAQALFGALAEGLDKSNLAKAWSSSTRRIKDFAVPILFAARLLDDPGIADTGFGSMSEVDTFYQSPRYGPDHPGHYMFGYTVSETAYVADSSKKWLGDPYGLIEQTSYQWCCSMGPWQAGALVIHLIRGQTPELKAALDVTGFLWVVGRFFDGWDNWQGAEHDPYECGLVTNDVAYNGGDVCRQDVEGPGSDADCHLTHTCECSAGEPRYPDRHGTTGYTTGCADDDIRGGVTGETDFGFGAWRALRSCADPVQGDGAASASFPCAGMAL